MNLFTKQIDIDSQTQKTNLWLPKGNGRGGIKQEFGINRYTLLYIKLINSKDLLQSTGNYIQYLVIIYNGKESEKEQIYRGFPDGAVVQSLPANAGDTGSSPGLGRSHMLRSNQACEPQLLSLRVWSLCSATREAATRGAAIVRGPHTAMKSGPHLPQLEKALTQKRRPNTAINK